MRQFILRWAGGWPKTKTVATELTDHCVTRFYSLVSVTHFTFSHLQKRNDPITKYRWKSCVMQRGLAMDVAGVCVSVQTDMVKTHMATGRNTPPQQHLWWLTIHSGKRRRFVVYTTQKKTAPVSHQEILQHRSCTLVHGSLQTASLIHDQLCTSAFETANCNARTPVALRCFSPQL